MDDKKTQKQKAVEEESVNDEVETLKSELEDYKSKYLRALADYQNFEKRFRNERDEAQMRAKIETILDLLPFLDHLGKAELFIKDPGLKMIKDQFMKTLGEMGVKELHLQGKEYDPHTAEAIEVVEGDKDNMVVEVIEKGYALGDRLLRVAKVKVSRATS